ncbi:LLM class flavin-dependent oxidoreductase [Actinomadura xylanilytica]|nr:LLM class flavin-dependent oxidoreductase [Actinomadura xylanilytica]MDL4770686.1 LLM class flavin-dependent oxidoreductase [Actinomadura xylanilytica]
MGRGRAARDRRQGRHRQGRVRAGPPGRPVRQGDRRVRAARGGADQPDLPHPVLIGGHSPAAARRAGRLGDGLQPLGVAGDDLRRLVQTMRDEAERGGRDAGALETEAAERGVEQAIAFDDPAGTPVEVFFGPILDHRPSAPAGDSGSSPAPRGWATWCCPRPGWRRRSPSTPRSSGSCRAARSG